MAPWPMRRVAMAPAAQATPSSSHQAQRGIRERAERKKTTSNYRYTIIMEVA